MRTMGILHLLALIVLSSVNAVPSLANPNSLVILLPYATYEGFHNDTSGLDVWLGVRYGSYDGGEGRWKVAAFPTPVAGGGGVTKADVMPKACPQNVVDLDDEDDEDCLFLNVYAPPGSSSSESGGLPVLVWIHGGSWDHNSAKEFDPTPMINLGGNGFVGVVLQYRLGLFGFLAGSEDIQNDGHGWNVGIKDARLALQWVQKYIGLFGGDKDRVTIWGQSAGGGTILQLVTQEGLQSQEGGSPLFRAAILSSPWAPPLGNCMDDFFVEQFHNISTAAGCPGDLECLRGVNTAVLKNLNIQFDHPISATHRLNYYTACIEGDIPGAYIKQHPFKSIAEGQVYGQSLIAGSNAADGGGETPSDANLASDAQWEQFLLANWPLTPDDIDELLNIMYPVDAFADAHERATVLYQDTVFSCSSTMLARAFAEKGEKSWRYLFAVPPATHAEDNAYEFPIWYAHEAPNSPTMFSSYTGETTSFIRFGDPDVARPPLADGLAWPSVVDGSGGMTKVFNITPVTNISAVSLQPLDNALSGSDQRCAFWSQIRLRSNW